MRHFQVANDIKRTINVSFSACTNLQDKYKNKRRYLTQFLNLTFATYAAIKSIAWNLPWHLADLEFAFSMCKEFLRM